jgi:hypothetical protein
VRKRGWTIAALRGSSPSFDGNEELPWVISSWISTSAASACNTAIGFLFHIFGIRLPDSHISNRREGSAL